jgi:beta-phosphoglucomutase-like phosphatase (HAD superfamily)
MIIAPAKTGSTSLAAIRRRRAGRAGSRPSDAPAPSGSAREPPDFDALARGWQRALDTAELALDSAAVSLPVAEIGLRRQALTLERRSTEELLVDAATAAGAATLPWLSPVLLSPRMLGLPAEAEACIFDLEGVLTDAARLHVWAWTVVFDDFFARLGERTGWRLAPFAAEDYRAYFDGRPRLDAIHAFLLSRAVHVPDGDPSGRGDQVTAHSLARRKGEVLAQRLRPRGVTALTGARRYLQAVGQAGLRRGVVSASSNTLAMLEVADLERLVDVQIDADVMREAGLRARPAPDLLIAACRRLRVPAEAAVSLTHSPAGVLAAEEAGLTVIGVGSGEQGDLLRAAGARRVVESLSGLLYPRLRSP